MTYFKLIIRSLYYYRKTNFSVLLGVFIATTILTGGLIIGDSVKYSLKQITKNRLGSVRYALKGGERFFRAELAADMSKKLNVPIVPLLQVKGIAIAEGGTHRANNIQINGVDSLFWKIADIQQIELKEDEIFINQNLADKLKAKAGDEILLRLENANVLPLNAPFVSDTKWSVAKRYRIAKILTDKEMGRFSLQTKQIAPYNVFVELNELSKQLELEGLCNTILVAPTHDSEVNIQQIDSAFHSTWTLEDANLKIKVIDSLNVIELTSERVFFDTSVAYAAKNVHKTAQAIITYFVNSIEKDTASTPYSFVSAAGLPIVPNDMADNEIIINRWLADDLAANIGDTIVMNYFVVGAMRQLSEKNSKFVVKQIVEMSGAAIDKNLMPDFPGLSTAGNCRDWEAGIPIDLEAIRDKDEAYWDTYKGTPKAFITLKMAQKMWQNRFGTYTAFRYDAKQVNKKIIQNAFAANFNPASLGLVFMPVYQQGIAAAENAVDFGELFLSLSFFIIFAALLLTALLFSMNTQLRSKEYGILQSVGFSTKKITQLLAIESFIIATIGALLGSIGGIFYNIIILKSLAAVWRDAVRTSNLLVDIQLSTIIIGVLSGIITALISMYITLWRKKQYSLVQLQQNATQWQTAKRKTSLSWRISIVSFIGVSIVLILSGLKPVAENASLFFIAGGLLLIGLISLVNILLINILNKKNIPYISLHQLAYRNSSRQKGRSLTVVALIAIGAFSVISTGANRKDLFSNSLQRTSGTGGYAFWAETTMPILYNLNQQDVKNNLGLSDLGLDSVHFFQCKVLEGNDASCLNLNQIEIPTILGVNSHELAEREAFSFANISSEAKSKGWDLLTEQLNDSIIPAIADQTVITWGLKKQIGDTLLYKNEKGETIRLKLVAGLANSVFQGNVIISDGAFIRHFPSVSGSKIMLIDVPQNQINEAAAAISQLFVDNGIDLSVAAQRLAEFNSVENTYLSIFLALGGLGVILGTIGMAVVVVRNTAERKHEFAIMLSIGFTIKHIIGMTLKENIFLLLCGVLVGVAAAVVATLPSLLSPAVSVPYMLIICIIIAIVASGFLWIYLSARFSMNKKLIDYLRNE